MSFTLTFGQEGPCATAQVVWSVDGQTYNFRSDNNFIGWISTIFTVADVVAGGGGVANPLVLPDNTNPNGWSLNTLDNGGVGGSITMIGDPGEDGLYPSNAGTINLSARVGGDGGSIDLRGSADSDGGNKSAGGSINLSAGLADGSPGGNITSTGSISGSASGGSLNMSAIGGVAGGSIDTSGGGSINTSGEGGSINTSNLGGSINTSGYNGSGGGSISTHADQTGNGGVGGSITMIGNNGGNAGSLNTSADAGSGSNGGSITTVGGISGAGGGSINTSGGGNDGSSTGGSISTNGGTYSPGGYINTSGGSDVNTSGGYINTGGGGSENDFGGYISTYGGGGSIDTTGTGIIQFGYSGSRTTVQGSATFDQTLILPNASGTIPAILSSSPTITFGTIGGNGAVVANDQTINGASVGDAVLVTCTSNRTTLTAGATSNIIFDGLVTGFDTVSVRAHNPHSNSITLGALNFRILVFKGV